MTGLSAASSLAPNNSQVLYASVAANGGCYFTDRFLLKSTDGGATWSAINTGLAGIMRAREPITALTIDPNLSALYLGTSGSGLFQSRDGGASWNPINDGLPSLDIRALAVSPDGSGTVFAGTPAGIFRSEPGRTLEGR